MTVHQSALNLELAPTYLAHDFVVSNSNSQAHQWITRWPQWPSHCLILTGENGCGKTHLAHIWAKQAQAEILASESLQDFDLESWIQSPHSLVLDSLDDNAPAERLLHIYNLIKEHRKFLLLTTETNPHNWKFALADLASRLKSTPTVATDQPDEELLRVVMIKLFADQQIVVGLNVIDYTLARINRSFAAVQKSVAAINLLALAKQRKITIPLVREVLQSLEVREN